MTHPHLQRLVEKWRDRAKVGYEQGTMTANVIRMQVACADELEAELLREPAGEPVAWLNTKHDPEDEDDVDIVGPVEGRELNEAYPGRWVPLFASPVAAPQPGVDALRTRIAMVKKSAVRARDMGHHETGACFEYAASVMEKMLSGTDEVFRKALDGGMSTFQAQHAGAIEGKK